VNLSDMLPPRRTLRVAAWVLGSVVVTAPLYAKPPPPTPQELEFSETLKQPNAWFVERLKGPPETVDGQTMHPKMQWVCETVIRTKPANRPTLAQRYSTAAGAAESRALVERNWNIKTKVTEEMAKTEDRQIAGPGGSLKVRIYTPRTSAKGPLPGLVYFHGGGWFFGSIEAVDRAVRLIANEAKVMVISADYRLAPEHKFPSAQDDAYAVFRWTQANAGKLGMDPARIGIGGDSAGGQMSAVTSLRLRDRHQPMPAFMLLYYPAVDMSLDYRSWQLFGEGYGLDLPFAKDMLSVYFKGVDLNSQEASPLRAASLAGLPPAIIATAGFDPLRDSGRVFAEKLMDQGVPVIYKNYSTLMHGFMQQSAAVDDAEVACNETARWLGARLRTVAAAK